MSASPKKEKSNKNIKNLHQVTNAVTHTAGRYIRNHSLRKRNKVAPIFALKLEQKKHLLSDISQAKWNDAALSKTRGGHDHKDHYLQDDIFISCLYEIYDEASPPFSFY